MITITIILFMFCTFAPNLAEDPGVIGESSAFVPLMGPDNSIGRSNLEDLTAVIDHQSSTINLLRKMVTDSWQTCENSTSELLISHPDITWEYRDCREVHSDYLNKSVACGKNGWRTGTLRSNIGRGVFTTVTQPIPCTDCALNWRKVYAHDMSGGMFSDLEEAKNKNVDDENAKLFSRLYDLESMRDNDGMFHFKLCYPDFTEENFPCNEWKQSSNPLIETSVTGFVDINLTWPLKSNNGPFGGLMRSNPKKNLMDDDESDWWWNSVGTLSTFQGKLPGPVNQTNHYGVNKKELYVFTYTP